MPKVSLLTPLYKTNHDHLRKMIESVLSQTYTDFEFILLNDSPDDQTIKPVVEEYKDSRIRYLENGKNEGISASRNILIDESKGEYLAILDHDDICFPYRLEEQVAYLEKHPEIGVLSGLVELMSTKNCHLKRYPEANSDIKERLLTENCIAHSAMMIRASVIKQNSIRYDALYSPAEDYHLCIQLIPYTLFHNLQKPLIIYRDDYENTTRKQLLLMEDKKSLVRSIANRDFSEYRSKNRIDWLLFGVINIISVKTIRKGKMYLLFGLIPFMLRKER